MKNNRLQWFLDRIGKRVYRNGNDNCCEVCNKVYREGLIISDDTHANYLYDVEGSFSGIKYFDTKHEVEQFERERKC